jgi:FkbM family methyltransferase
VRLLSDVRRFAHPMHVLRRTSSFQWLLRHWDPVVRRSLPGYAHPISLRLLRNSSFAFASEALEPNIRKTFGAVAAVCPGGFADVGANVGMFTFAYATINPGAPIVALEPDAINADCLDRTLRGWPNAAVAVLRAAAADHTGTQSFLPDPLSGATGTIVAGEQTFNEQHYGLTSRATAVSCVKLDDVVGTIRQPAIVKIDVEGAELRVIGGGAAFLRDVRPVVLLESFTHGAEIQRRLGDLGYAVFDSDTNGDPTADSSNFLAVHPQRTPGAWQAIGSLGYPVSSWSNEDR